MWHTLLGAVGAAVAYRLALHGTYSGGGPGRSRLEVATADGATLGVYRVEPSKKRYAEPVFFCHGLGSNRFNLDFEAPYSVAEAFALEGFDCWVAELRGAGMSRPPVSKPNWSFDDYLDYDLPAILDLMLEKTGQSSFHWVGHSMGGMLLYAFLLGPRGGEVRCGIALASPAGFSKGKERFALELRLGFLLPWLGSVPLRELSRWTVPLTGRLDHRFIRGIFNAKNMEPAVARRVQYLATSDLSAALAEDFLRWLRAGTFSSKDGSICWTEQLEKIDHPLLFVAGGGDALAPPCDVRRAFEMIASRGSEYLELSRQNGFEHDYGHVDLVLGRKAPQVVYPRLLAYVRRFARKIAP